MARAAGALVARHAARLGVAGAEATGLSYAARHGFERVVRLDADGQHDPQAVMAVLGALDAGADLVIGSRYLNAPSPAGPLSARRLGSQFLARLLSFTTGLEVTDPTSGLRGFSTKARDVFSTIEVHGYPEPESILLAARRHLRVREVEVRMRPRLAGESTLTPLASAFYMLKVCFSLSVELLRPR